MSLHRVVGRGYKAWPFEAGASLARLTEGRSCEGARVWTSKRLKIQSQNRLYAASAETEKQKQDQDRETFITVLEAAATKRDAKTYLKTFASPGAGKPKAKAPTATSTPLASRSLIPHSPQSVSEQPQFVQGRHDEPLLDKQWLPHVALIKFVDPQSWDDETLRGLAKTLGQLNMLGLHSIVVVDCGLDETEWSGWRRDVSSQIDRIVTAFEVPGKPGARVLEGVLTVASSQLTAGESTSERTAERTSYLNDRTVRIDFEDSIRPALESGCTILLPSIAYEEGTLRSTPVKADDVIFALTTSLSGLQVPLALETHDAAQVGSELNRHAVVDRVIVLDSLGGIPRRDLPGAVRVFVNLEEEFRDIKNELAELSPSRSDPSQEALEVEGAPQHIAQQRYFGHLELARRALAMLPSTASAVITTPREAGNLGSRHAAGRPASASDFLGDVGTRKKQNPLIHNLLTDRPIYSSSLPSGRLKTGLDRAGDLSVAASGTTLIKRGMPVTIFPDPRTTPWQPPKPGWSGLRLTDMRIDLPRLIYLIEDSFNRKLDVQHYLTRVQNNIAGVIIAGEYEGGAILTWERPPSLDEDCAYREARLVPYLDKFAVLKKSQGAGGVADIVFNAMVRDCFPAGVCWRSRKDNPVNRWYFERSLGIWKLRDSNWTMFWTTPDVAIGDQTARDYEAVCRNVVPSWADRKQPAD